MNHTRSHNSSRQDGMSHDNSAQTNETRVRLSSQNLGQRNTPQRDAILRVIEQAGGPLSVPEIHALSQKTMPKLGIATIYRTIRLLLESEQIQSVILPSGETRYERAGLGHHDHFQCRKCQSVFDLDICPSGLHSGMTLPGGFVVEDHEMTVYGLCADCANTSARLSSKNANKKSRR